MTYHVDLLLDDERRSASPVSVGMVLRLGAFGAVATILMMTLMLFIASRDVQGRMTVARATWERLKPQHTELLSLRVELNGLRASSRQIEACRRSRLPLGNELAQLQDGVPEDIQLTALRINQFVGNQKVGANATRSYEMRLSGKVASDNPQGNVDELIKHLKAQSYTGRVESVTVPNNGFRKEIVRVSASETRTDWFFELVCRYRSRSFE
ncbi:MAG: hypothetical protein WCI17_06665 [bacterium]